MKIKLVSAPPPDGRTLIRNHKGKLWTVWEALRKKPKRWALVKKTNKMLSAQAYRRHHPDFEFVTRRVGKVAALYARYVGKVATK